MDPLYRKSKNSQRKYQKPTKLIFFSSFKSNVVVIYYEQQMQK